MPADALGACLDWIYTGTCVAADDSALHAILEAAIFLQIAPLIEAAREVVQRRLGPATALATWRLADLFSWEKLKTYATTTCCFHFSSLSRRQEWLSAPVAFVRTLLSDDRLRLRSEDEAYKAAIAWLRAREPPADANMAKDLLALVRYSPLLTVRAPALHAKVAPRGRRGFAPCLYALGGKDGKPNAKKDLTLS